MRGVPEEKREKIIRGVVKMADKLDSILEKYAETARMYGELMEKGDFDTAAIFFEKNEKVLNKLLTFGTIGARALITLLNHENPHIRLSAATNLLNTFPDKALPIIREITGRQGFLGFNAEMVLSYWKKNDLVIPKFRDN